MELPKAVHRVKPGQVHYPGEESGHLPAGDRQVGAEVALPAPFGDFPHCDLFDGPGVRRVGYVGEARRFPLLFFLFFFLAGLGLLLGGGVLPFLRFLPVRLALPLLLRLLLLVRVGILFFCRGRVGGRVGGGIRFGGRLRGFPVDAGHHRRLKTQGGVQPGPGYGDSHLPIVVAPVEAHRGRGAHGGGGHQSGVVHLVPTQQAGDGGSGHHFAPLGVRVV